MRVAAGPRRRGRVARRTVLRGRRDYREGGRAARSVRRHRTAVPRRREGQPGSCHRVGEQPGGSGSGRAPVHSRPARTHRSKCDRARRGRARRQVSRHRLQQAVAATGARRSEKGARGSAERAMRLNPDIFKAYDVRGVYPSEINEEGARAIGAAFIAYLKASRVAVGRDMRLSSPALAAAFIDGVTSQGADVVDYGMIATDMLYFAVAADRLEGGVQITASHNPRQYNGMKMVRQEAFPLSGEAGISDIRDAIAGDRLT